MESRKSSGRSPKEHSGRGTTLATRRKPPTGSLPLILRMDIPHRDHPHLIGRGGSLVNSIMATTDCRVHFPDENVHDDSGHKSNVVEVGASSLQDVESGRASLRDSMPINVGLSVDRDAKWTLTDSKNIGTKFSVDIRRIGDVIWVKAAQSNVKTLDGAIEAVAAALKRRPSLMELEFPITKALLPLVRGGAMLNMRRIADASGVVVETSANEDGLVLRGAISRCIMAYKMIIGSLPLELSFSVQGITVPPAAVLEKLSRMYDCLVRIEDKGKMAVLTTYERNAGNLYKVCGVVLGQLVHVKCSLPEEYLAPADPVYSFRHTHQILTLKTDKALTSANDIPPPPEKPSVIKIDLGCTIVPQITEPQPLVAAAEDPLLVLLRENNLHAVYPQFQLHQVDLTVFRTMTEVDFVQVGIQAFGVRRRLSSLVNRFNH